MLRTHLFALIPVILAGLCLASVEGKDCYSCYYVEGVPSSALDIIKSMVPGLSWDKSCRDGKVPDKKYKKDCPSVNSAAGGSYCGKIYAQEKLSDDVNVRVSMRGCFQSNKNLSEKCESKTLKSLADLGVDLKGDLNVVVNLAYTSLSNMTVNGTGSPITDPTKLSGQFCACDGDTCNSSSLLEASYAMLLAISVFMLKGSLES